MPISDGYRFCTVDDVKAVSTIHQAFAGLDDRIANWIRIATTQVTNACQRQFIEQTGIIEYFPTPDRGQQDLAFSGIEPYSVYLVEPNVNPDTIQVWLSYRAVWDSSVLLDPANGDYFLETLRGNNALFRVNITGCLRHHSKSLKIQYDAGYEAGDDDDADLYAVPTELVEATAIQTGFLMSRAGNEEVGTGDVSRRQTRFDPRSTPQGVTPEANYLLRKWRRNLTGSM